MVVLSPPPLISPEGYFYTSEPLTASEDIGDDLTNAPAGYPGTVAVLDGPPPPTLIRMWQGPSNGQQGWSAYQPMPNDPSMHPNWNQGPPPPMPPPGGPKKRAFICGINYLGLSCRLNGCINDAKCMEYLLKSKFNFAQDQILLMTDDNPNPVMRPTRQNMYQGFQWLMTGLQPGDSLVFHYSGHGSQQRDYTGEETDGMNETICPVDFQSQSEIVDDELNRMLVNPLPQGVKLHAIIDACHSGSVLDLPYQATVRGGYATWNAAYAGQTRAWKGTGGGFCVQFSAAKDSQTAADTSQLSGGVATGAATFCFIKAVEDRGVSNVTYGDLLLSMSRTLQAAGLGGSGGGGAVAPVMGGGGLESMLFGMLTGAGGGSNFRGQEPVMSANYAFDMSFKFSI